MRGEILRLQQQVTALRLRERTDLHGAIFTPSPDPPVARVSRIIEIRVFQAYTTPDDKLHSFTSDEFKADMYEQCFGKSPLVNYTARINSVKIWNLGKPSEQGLHGLTVQFIRGTGQRVNAQDEPRTGTNPARIGYRFPEWDRPTVSATSTNITLLYASAIAGCKLFVSYGCEISFADPNFS